MRVRPGLKLQSLPRMADFASWGAAIAMTMGNSAEDFLAAYERNYVQRNEEILVNDPIASAVLGLMEVVPSWEGSASELLSRLTRILGC